MVPTKYVNAVDYLEGVVTHENRKRKINNALKTIRKFIDKLPKCKKPKAVACCGVSGLMIAPAIADRLGLDLIVVRKRDDDSTHSRFGVEGVAADNYIIVDDLICTGRTMTHMLRRIHSHLCEYSTCVGAYLYHTNRYRPKAQPMMTEEQILREFG